MSLKIKRIEMNITAEKHDEVSQLLTVTLDKKDYKERVEKSLINYAKNAQIPGFRKGKVPLSMVRKQYEAGLTFEEINKKVSEGLNNYINENKIRLVGQPIPVPVEELDLNQDQVSVQFEIGTEPEFNIDLSKYEADYYKIEASDKEVSKSVENMQKRFATREETEKIDEDTYVVLEVSTKDDEEDKEAPNPHTVNISKEEAAFDLVKNLGKEEQISVKKEDLSEEIAKSLNLNLENVGDEVKIVVKDFYKTNLAELNQELFDKVYGQGNVTSEEELRAKVKTELDEYFQQNADIYFVNRIIEEIIDKQEVQLPENFLVKWLMFSNQEIQSEQQAREILEREKEVIRYQIIEGKLLNDNDIKIDYAEVLEGAKTAVKNQLAMYGIHDLEDEQIQSYAIEMLKNEEQVRQISSEVANNKLKDIILEKAGKKESAISHDEFNDLVNKKNEELKAKEEAKNK